MARTIILLFTFCVFIACQSQRDKNRKGNQLTKKQNTQQDTIFGKSFKVQDPLSSRDLINKMQDKNKVHLQVKGTIQEVCQKKGCWLTLPLTDTNNIRVRFKNYGFFVPKDIAGEEVVLNGKAYYDTLSVKMRKHYARDKGKSPKEIKNIDKPKTQLAFTASGVVLRRKD